MKVNYTSSVTGNRTSARVDENLWSIFSKVSRMTGLKESDSRANVEHWIKAFDKEYREWADNLAPTFSAYISMRLTQEILMDLSVMEDKQERLKLA